MEQPSNGRSLHRMVLADTGATKPALPELGSSAFSPMPLSELREYVEREIREARRRKTHYHEFGHYNQFRFADGQHDALVGVLKRINGLETASGIGTTRAQKDNQCDK